ncbi:MAG: hypothetical protein PHU85_00260 [Phycisphaerae bacterium]|nr:hypothetical protein [Phycisphaerae bacterium]
MDIISASLAADRRRRASAPIAPPTASETAQPLWKQALSVPFDAASSVLAGMGYVDAATRAALGRAFGVEGTGQETIFGPAPSGRELLGLGAGEKGTFESGDIPGTAVEVLASPFNLLSFGGATAAGKAARGVSALADAARVAETAAKLEKTAPALARAAELAGELGRKGYTLADAPVFPRSLAEQAAKGYRRGLTVGLPFDIGPQISVSLTGGRASGAAFRGLDAARRGVGRFAEPVASRLRPASAPLADAAWNPETLSTVRTELGRDPTSLFNEIPAQARGAKELRDWEIGQAGRAAIGNIERFAAEQPGESVGALKRLAESTEPGREAIRTRFGPKIAAAEAAGDTGKAAGLSNLRDKLLRETAIPLRAEPLQAAKTLTYLALEKGDEAAQKVAGQIDALTTKHAASLAKRDAAIADALQAGDVARVTKLTGLRAAAEAKTASRIETLTSLKDTYAQVQPLLPKPLAFQVEQMRAALGVGFDADVRSGQKLQALSDNLLGYTQRVLNPEAVKWLPKLAADDPLRTVIRDFPTSGRYALERVPELKGLAVPVINDLGRLRGLPGDLFVENPAESMTRRLLSGSRTQFGAGVATGALTLFALPAEKAGPDAVKIADLLAQLKLNRVGGVELPAQAVGKEAIAKALEGTAFAGKYVPAEIAREITKVDRLVNDPESMGKVWKFLNKTNAVYRLAVTQMFPAFHARNAIDDVFRMYLGGFRDPTYLFKAGKLQMAVTNRLAAEAGETIAAGARRATDAEMALYKKGVEYATVGHGMAPETRELLGWGPGAKPGETPGVLSRAASAVAKPFLRPWAKAGIAVGNAAENNRRLAMFLEAKARGLSDREAGGLVKKYLFDYGDLSRFESNTLRRITYFYTYVRKALPLIVKEVVENPNLLRGYGYATGAIGSRSQGVRELLPTWLQERQPFQLPSDAQGQARFISPGLALEEPFSFGTEGKGPVRSLQKIAAQAAPFPRFLLEMLTDTDLRTGRSKLAPDKATTRLIGELPPALQKETRFIADLARFLPSSRFSQTAETLTQAAVGGGNRTGGGAALALLGGLSTQRVNPARARIQGSLGRTEEALTNLEAMGLTDSARAKELRSLRGRLRRQLQKVPA